MIDETEMLPLSQVAKLLPAPLHGVHASTAIRWALRGVGNPRVKIATVKIGGRRYVTREAVDRFVAQLSAGPAAPVTVAADRGREIRRAEQELDADGL